jgi:hypothetical protein
MAFAAAEPLCKRITPASAEPAVRLAFETLSFVANVLFLAIDASSRSKMAIYCDFVKSVRVVNPRPSGEHGIFGRNRNPAPETAHCEPARDLHSDRRRKSESIRISGVSG